MIYQSINQSIFAHTWENTSATEQNEQDSKDNDITDSDSCLRNNEVSFARYTYVSGRRRSMLPETGSAHVRRLFYIRLQVEKEVCVVEEVGVRLIVWTVLEVDVSHELRVVVVWTRYDDLVQVDDDCVAVAVDVTHHTVVERRGVCQVHHVHSRLNRSFQLYKQYTDFIVS